MSGYIPQEVLINIFLKLSPETLIFCLCVSKSWRSIITDPSFITNHASTHNNHKLLILRRNYATGTQKKERYSLHYDTDALDLYRELKFPFVNRNGDFKLVCISNGLVCLSGDSNILLWNPSIQRAVAVPWISDIISIYGVPDKYALGFCFDSRADDYKVVRLLYFEDKSPFKCKRSPKVELYEVRTGSWRSIENKAPRCEIVRSEWTQAFVNGGIHWVAYRESGRGYKCRILRFDIVEECFSYIDLPECLFTSSPYDLKLAVLGEALSIMVCVRHCFETYGSSVWVLQKCSMSEFWTEPIIFYPFQQFGLVLGIRDNGDMIMESKSGEMVLYNPEQQITEGLGIYGGEGSFYLDTFVESLGLLNEGIGDLEKVAEVYG